MADTHLTGRRAEAAGEARDVAGKAQGAAHQAADGTKHAIAHPIFVVLARFGYAAKGLVYVIMGGLSAAAALGTGGEDADAKSAIHVIALGPAGRFLLGLVAIGLAGYALWCLVRTVFDPDHLGIGAKGIVTRAGYAVVGIAYSTLAFAAYQIAAGTGSGGKSTDTQARDFTIGFMKTGVGVPVIVLTGLVFVAIALALVYVVYSAQFMRQIKRYEAPEPVAKAIVWLGRFGYAALAVIFAEIGAFLVVAALRRDPGEARGLGGALATLAATHPAVPLLLGIVAFGLIAYGSFSLAEARYRRIGPV
jgi:hypothetical protein